MGTRRNTGDPHPSVEGIRAQEVRCVRNKLGLSPEQTEAIERFSRSLVEKLLHGPIAETVALVGVPKGIGGQPEIARSKEYKAARAQQLRSSKGEQHGEHTREPIHLGLR